MVTSLSFPHILGYGGLPESSDEEEALPLEPGGASSESGDINGYAAAKAYLDENGWEPLEGSDHGRHNGGIFKRGTDIAKIEYLPSYADTVGMERNLQSWIAAGIVPHVVTLKAFKFFPDCLVTMMTRAPGAEMSKVLREPTTRSAKHRAITRSTGKPTTCLARKHPSVKSLPSLTCRFRPLPLGAVPNRHTRT